MGLWGENQDTKSDLLNKLLYIKCHCVMNMFLQLNEKLFYGLLFVD